MLRSSATELSRRIRQRELSPVEVVDAHIRRIEAVNPRLNAITADRFEIAREEAVAAEKRVKKAKNPERLPPLLGVPCTIKEFISVAGQPLTAGLVSRRHQLAESDATVVQRLRKAGAIVMASTNVPEGGIWMETYNNIYGRTNNPWDVRHTSGGSSGGEGAIIGAGGSPFGLGSDVGGSIRLPAAFCGIAGHKPSGRLVPNTGHFPEAVGAFGAYMVTGPLARRVEDLMPLLRIIAGPDDEDRVTRKWTLGDPAKVDLTDVVVYPALSHGRARISRAMRGTVTRAAEALAARGATIGSLKTPWEKNSFGYWGAILAEVPGQTYAQLLGDGDPIRPLAELVKLTLRRSNYTLPALVIAALENAGRLLPGGGIPKLARAARRIRDSLEAEIGPNGVILHPPYSSTAPRHKRPLLKPFDAMMCGIFNVFEFPATQVPMGFDGAGLPLGVQVAGRRGNDHLTIAVALALEEDFGGWTGPPHRGRNG
jgi:fatty acid amide hydrolase 2